MIEANNISAPTDLNIHFFKYLLSLSFIFSVFVIGMQSIEFAIKGKINFKFILLPNIEIMEAVTICFGFQKMVISRLRNDQTWFFLFKSK